MLMVTARVIFTSPLGPGHYESDMLSFSSQDASIFIS